MAYCGVQLVNSMDVIVVCDTNVFVRETHLLRKKGGPDLLRQLRATNGRLLVPDILRTEYIEQTLEAATAERQRFESASGVLGTLIGFLHQPLPTNDAITQNAVDRLRALEPITLPAPLSTEILEAAGLRSVSKRRPTSKTDHGYKDCLIWESVLRLPAGSDVRFVSRDDKAFFNGEHLAQDLIDEAQAKEIKVVGYKNLEDLVRDLRAENPTLNLAVLEAQDLSETAIAAPEEDAVAYVAPVAVVAAPGQATPGLASAEGDVQEVARRLVDARKRFDELDLKILAYIAYLDPAGRDQLFQLLNQLEIPTDAARNIVERLVMSGFVRDIGNHYFIADRAVAEVVAPTVEDEIINLLRKDSVGHGH